MCDTSVFSCRFNPSSFEISLISAPAEKAFFPAPVKIMTLTSSDLSTIFAASTIPSITLLLIAFLFSGRLIIIVAIEP